MIKSIGNSSEPLEVGCTHAQTSIAKNSLSHAKVFPVKRARGAGVGDNPKRLLSKDSPLAGACVIQPVPASEVEQQAEPRS